MSYSERVAPRRSWLLTIVAKPWLVWSLLGLCLVAAGIVVSAVCTLSPSRASTLEADPFERSDLVAFEVKPRVPESFMLEADAPATAPQRAPVVTPPRSTDPPVATPPSELDLLRGARIALVKRDPARALADLEEHSALYPRGSLREEAAALRVEALARSGDAAAARGAAARFARLYPDSPYAERVRSIAAGLPHP